MATNKTITPTNVTVSVPAFTDQPDQRVNSNCIDKIIDGVNTGPVSSKVMQAYYDSTYDYYGIEAKNVGAGTNGHVSMLIAPGVPRLQLKYTKNGTTTTKNFKLSDESAPMIVAEAVNTDYYQLANGERYEFTKSVAKTGYTPLGIIEINGGNVFYSEIRYFYIENGTLKVGLINNCGVTKNTNVKATILYIRN